MSATFALRILEEYLWKKGSLKISYREHSYIFLFIYFFESVTLQGTLWNGVSYDYKYSGDNHCVKNHAIRSFFGSYFPVFVLNTGKYRPEKTPYLDTFHALKPCTNSALFFAICKLYVILWVWRYVK